ncbi:MAG: DUF3943 domain-containing protein [Deltaproteobacteria bacterium]
MKTRVSFLTLLTLFYILSAGPVTAADQPVYLFSSEDKNAPVDSEDVVIPVGNEDSVSREPDLRPAGFKEYMYDTTIWYGVQWAGRLWYVRDKNQKIFDASFSKWWHNLKSKPVWDDGDDFAVNWVLHPFFGMLSYQFYRARGHSFWASALGSVIQSTLFEYAIEGTVIEPSGVDLVVTPALGVPLGWTMEKLSEWLIEQDSKAAQAAAYVANPMRLFVKNRNIGILNPVSGSFEFHGPFTISTSKERAIELGYPLFFEPPLPLGRVGIDFEIINLKKDLGGELILYPIRLEFPSESKLWGVYLDIPYGGVNNVKEGDVKVRDGFELGNLVVGVKRVAFESENAAVTGGVEVLFPTAFTDSQDRLKQVIKYRRDFPDYLFRAVTASPYISFGLWRGALSMQGSVGSDFIFNAKNFEGDDFEFRIGYQAAVAVNVPMPASPVVYFEFDGFTITTDDTSDKTDLFITPGIRFGKKYSPGFAVQFPVEGPTTDVSDVDFILDFQLRF